jgi:hypothetical protein
MTRTVLRSQVGPDGVLKIVVPLGEAEANREVMVTVEATLPQSSMDSEEWRAWVQRSSGSIADPTFQRHEQGKCEEREELT